MIWGLDFVEVTKFLFERDLEFANRYYINDSDCPAHSYFTELGLNFIFSIIALISLEPVREKYAK